MPNKALRNVAIIAHVDHGKTTLVDQLLYQSGMFRNEDLDKLAGGQHGLIMDSNPLERERGITILSKNCAVHYVDPDGLEFKINVIDTPGHADFGGEVERVLKMADGVLLLVDAFEGPMPQTRFVLGKALEHGLRPIVIVNKADRPDARPDDVVDEVFDLLVQLEADDETMDFPLIYASAKEGWARERLDSDNTDMRPIFETIIRSVPYPLDDREAPPQMLVTSLDYSDYVGRIAIGRIFAGSLTDGQPVTVIDTEGRHTQQKILQIHQFQGLGKKHTASVDAGDICAISGLDPVDIGNTIACADQPSQLPVIAVDEPTMHTTFRINDGPYAGRDGSSVTSRQIAERLDKELQHNVALRVEQGNTPEEFKVSGRGLMHLGILLENMRREGFELCVGKPNVIIRMIDNLRNEPIELLVIDCPVDCQNSVMSLLGERRTEMLKMNIKGGASDFVHMDKKEGEKRKTVSYLKTRLALVLILVSLGYHAESVALANDDSVENSSPFSDNGESDKSLSEETQENHVSLAHIHLTGLLTETPTLDTLGLNGEKITSLKELVARFDQARTDDQITGVIVTTDRFALGAGQGEEIYRALGSLHRSGKSVYVHVDRLDTLSYALFSSATHLSIVPTADVWLTGFYSESIYLKGLLDKLGVQADILHMGDYKAAGEIFTRTQPSQEAEKNMQWLFDGLYGNVVDRISESRGLSLEQTRRIIDGGPYNDSEALTLKLVDSVQYRDAFLSEVKSTYDDKVIVKNHYGDDGALQVDMSNPFAFFSLFSSMMAGSAKTYKDSVAVVYVEGMILPGFGRPSLFGSDQNAYSGDIRKALEKAREDPSVKAVVLRVDSPGGSALASEIILHACEKVKENKPLIVSMGNLAASGGYYVACRADHIWADPSTLTASIGVVGGKLVTTGMWDKLGVNWVPYKRGKNADLLNSSSMFDEQQKAKMTKWMEEVYGVFKSHVVAGRGAKLTKGIDELAGGRVYTGQQALDLGLVDDLGGLTDAIAHAATQADLTEYEVRVIPEPVDFMTLLMEDLMGSSGRESPTDVTLFRKPVTLAPPLTKGGEFFHLLRRFEPHRARSFFQTMKRIELMRSEKVLLVMPTSWIIK